MSPLFPVLTVNWVTCLCIMFVYSDVGGSRRSLMNYTLD